jgi:hypothetical protein
MEKQFTYIHPDFKISVIAEDHSAAFKLAVNERLGQLMVDHPKLASCDRGVEYLFHRAFNAVVDAKNCVAQIVDRPSYLQSIMVAGL